MKIAWNVHNLNSDSGTAHIVKQQTDDGKVVSECGISFHASGMENVESMDELVCKCGRCFNDD